MDGHQAGADGTAVEESRRWAEHDALAEFSPREGIALRGVVGERLMVTWIRIEPHRELPIHHHPHEQIGVVLEGAIDVTIDGETRRVEPGGAYVVPSNLPHGGRTGAEGVLVLETFSPPREDYLAGLAGASPPRTPVANG